MYKCVCEFCERKKVVNQNEMKRKKKCCFFKVIKIYQKIIKKDDGLKLIFFTGDTPRRLDS